MTRDNSTVTFDDRDEVREVMEAVAAYISQHPERKNENLRVFCHILDTIDMLW